RPTNATTPPWPSSASAHPCWPPTPAMPETLLAFDFGTRKIGVALGNTLTGQARPLRILTPATREQRFAQVGALLDEWRPDRVLVGVPVTLAGRVQPALLQSSRFANQRRGRFGVAVELVDERGSSLEAQQILGSHADDDAMAACVIL